MMESSEEKENTYYNKVNECQQGRLREPIGMHGEESTFAMTQQPEALRTILNLVL